VLSDPDGDLTYEAVVHLEPGAHEYKYVICGPSRGELWETGIANRILDVAAENIVLDTVFFDDDSTEPIPPIDLEVRFSVDASLEMAWGRFDPRRDLIVVRGSHPVLGDWGGTGAVLTRDGPSPRFTGWARFRGISSCPIYYKYVVLKNGNAEDVLWEDHIENRVFRVTGNEPDNLPPGGDGYRELVTPTAYFDHPPEWSVRDRLVGADLSALPEFRLLGAEYRLGGVPGDPLRILRENGFGLVRLRLWHTPAEPWQGLDRTAAFAAETVAEGYCVMLDIHYSDVWADPAHQEKPEAWSGLDFPALVDSVYAYTRAVLRRFRDAGAVPEYVQLGNEISAGLLWDDGRVGPRGSRWDTEEQWARLGALLGAGAAAVCDALPEEARPEIVVHVDDGGDNALCRWFFDHIERIGVDYDVIGVSYYPWWHGSLGDLKRNLRDLAARYGKKVMVVETSYPWTLEERDSTGNFVDSLDDLHPGYPASPEGQAAFLRELLATIEGLPGGLGCGVVYWEPCFLALPGGPPCATENLALFDFDGNALPALGFAVPWTPCRRTDASLRGTPRRGRPRLRPPAGRAYLRGLPAGS